MGFPKTKNPVIDADMTNKSNIKSGIIKLETSPKIFCPLNNNYTTRATYINVPSAHKKLFI